MPHPRLNLVASSLWLMLDHFLSRFEFKKTKYLLYSFCLWVLELCTLGVDSYGCSLNWEDHFHCWKTPGLRGALAPLVETPRRGGCYFPTLNWKEHFRRQKTPVSPELGNNTLPLPLPSGVFYMRNLSFLFNIQKYPPTLPPSFCQFWHF